MFELISNSPRLISCLAIPALRMVFRIIGCWFTSVEIIFNNFCFERSLTTDYSGQLTLVNWVAKHNNYCSIASWIFLAYRFHFRLYLSDFFEYITSSNVSIQPPLFQRGRLMLYPWGLNTYVVTYRTYYIHVIVNSIQLQVNGWFFRSDIDITFSIRKIFLN